MHNYRQILVILTIYCLFSPLEAIQSKSSSVGYFLQISDIHLDMYYKEGSAANCKSLVKGLTCCRWYDLPMPHQSERYASSVGDINCDSPYLLVNASIRSAVTEWQKLDFVLWTGDTPGHHDFTQTMKYNMKTISNITKLLHYYLGDIPVYPCVGNHDTWPIDQLGAPPYDNPVTHSIADDWSIWLNENATRTLRYGGYYSQLIIPGLRVISLNTLFYDKDNIFIKLWKEKDIAHQWKWFNATLAEAKKNNEKVWIIGHVFPGTEEATKEFNNKYINLTYQYRDIIDQQFWGHSHFDALFLLEHENKLFAHGYISPSIVPDTKNPAYRIYSYDKNTLEVLDYTDYYFDLSKGIMEKEIMYQLLYSAKEDYSMINLTTEGWIDFYDRLINNKTLQKKYTYNYYLGNNNLCDKSCQSKLIKEIILSN